MKILGFGSSRPTDEELLDEARRGRASAFHELMDRLAPQMFRLAYRFVGNEADAEDVVQESFLGAYKALAGYRGQASVKTWISNIVVRQAARAYHSKMRTSAERIIETNAAQPENEGAPDRSMDVRKAIEKLSPEHRQVVVLREFEGMSYEEIAKALDVPAGTVESRLFRARQELRRLLKDYLPEQRSGEDE